MGKEKKLAHREGEGRKYAKNIEENWDMLLLLFLSRRHVL